MSVDAAESADILEFQRSVREWLVANKPAPPPFLLPQSFLEVESRQQFEYLRDWQRKLFDAGWLGWEAPTEYGGQGVDRDRHRVVMQELARARAPFLVNTIAINWVAPTLLVYGTEDQKKKFLKPLYSAQEIWCQGFSEPGAGSDLASLTTRAERTGSGYRVRGHKVWTTLAHFAKWMILLARTSTDVNKYAGLSYFLFPMDAPGVTIQPLVKMTGEGGFNQVLLDDAPMPADALLGREGQGWEIAMTTLMFERGAAEGKGPSRSAPLFEFFARLLSLATRTRRDGRLVSDDPVFRDRIAGLWVEVAAMHLSELRSGVPALSADRPLALPMMTKVVSSEWGQRLSDLACEMLGPEAGLWVGDAHAPDGADWPRSFMNSFGMTIGGGTSEILRNLLGERVLGLPKSK